MKRCVCGVVAVLLGCCALPAAALAWPGTWHVEPGANPPGADAGLDVVDCSGPARCVAVGHTPGSPNVIFAERRVGGRWTLDVMAQPAGAFRVDITGLACASATRCVAVGEADNSVLIERWDGSSWSLESAPAPASGFSFLFSVSCPTTRYCKAVGVEILGGAQIPLAETWRGAGWTIDATLPGDVALHSVSCTSSAACTAVGPDFGAATVLRWNGARWSAQATPALPVTDNNDALNAVSCGSPWSCTAVGSLGSFAGGISAPLIEHWNGNTWKLQSGAVSTGATLSAVSCSSGNVCTALGFPGPDASSTLAQRWTGDRWVVQSLPSSVNGALHALSCPTDASCTAVGGQMPDAATNATLVERFVG